MAEVLGSEQPDRPPGPILTIKPNQPEAGPGREDAHTKAPESGSGPRTGRGANGRPWHRLKGDWPHLTTIRDPAVLDTELTRVRREYNTVRLHASIGYVTPDDEHHGRGPQIRRARAVGMRRVRAHRIAENRANK